MRKVKTIKLDDLEVTFKELRVKDVRAMMDAGDDALNGDLLKLVDQVLPLCCDLPPEKIEEMAPSEMATLYDAFMEANDTLFTALKKSGLLEVLRDRWRKILIALPAILSSEVMPESSITAGDSS